MADNKGRILFLEHYLAEHSDESNPITTEQLIDAVSARGYSANRNTIYSDLKTLKAEGIQIGSIRMANATGYYIKNRPFQLSELKALIDSVSSSQFISERNSNTLIRRLAELAPEMYRKDLTATAFCADRIKTDSPVAFTALDAVNKAIQKKRKLSFQYVDYLPTKEEILRHNNKVYTVSPYALIWNDGRYYVPSYDPEKDTIVSYRVDRMRNAAVVREQADRDKPFDPADYCRKTLWMYDGDLEEQEVTLLSDNKYMINLLDRFGNGIPTNAIDDLHFQTTVRVIPSYTFFAWISQFCGGIRIIGPKQVKEDYEDMLGKIIEEQKYL